MKYKSALKLEKHGNLIEVGIYDFVLLFQTVDIYATFLVT